MRQVTRTQGKGHRPDSVPPPFLCVCVWGGLGDMCTYTHIHIRCPVWIQSCPCPKVYCYSPGTSPGKRRKASDEVMEKVENS